MAPIARLSGLQKDVLALYRSILREALCKDRKAASPLPSPSSTVSFHPQQQQQHDAKDATGADSSNNHHQHRHQHRLPFSQIIQSASNSTTSYARKKFRQDAELVRRSDFKKTEYLIRKGKKQLQLLKMPGVNVVGGVGS